MRAAGVVSGDGRLRVEGNRYIAALLLVESGRIASDGLEAPARHHLECVCVDVCTPTIPLTKLPMALILAGAWKSAEPRSSPRGIQYRPNRKIISL
jgi:hypothetical protein